MEDKFIRLGTYIIPASKVSRIELKGRNIFVRYNNLPESITVEFGKESIAKEKFNEIWDQLKRDGDI